MNRMATVFLVIGIVLLLVGGSFTFIGSGAWKLLGSHYEDRTSIAEAVINIQIASHGLAQVEIRPATGPNVEFQRTVRWQPPFTERPGQTYRLEGTTLFLDQADGISAVDYTVYVPEGVLVSQ
jgi:hypothetical protein